MNHIASHVATVVVARALVGLRVVNAVRVQREGITDRSVVAEYDADGVTNFCANQRPQDSLAAIDIILSNQRSAAKHRTRTIYMVQQRTAPDEV
jgi:hypothetical protein